MLEKLWEDNKPLSNLKWMDLRFSDNLKELPDLSTATNLHKLDLHYCSSLVELPSSIGNAINLKELNLTECSSLVELPFSIGNAINLKKLDLWHCSSLVELPSSIGNATNLQELNLMGCSSLAELPSSMRNLSRLSKLELVRCSKLEVVLANINLESLYKLNLTGCSLLKSHHESSTDIQELDPWIGRTSRLSRLVLRGMDKLVSLPPLPDSLRELYARYCWSLERLDCSFLNPEICLKFVEYYELNQEARDLIIHTPTTQFSVFPAEEVPQCFTYRSYGSSVTVKLNQMPLATSTKFKACVIFALVEEQRFEATWKSVCCSITSGGNVITSHIRKFEDILVGHLYTFEVEIETEEVTSTELLFDFDISATLKNVDIWEIKECGILQLLEVPLLSFKGVDSDYESCEDDDE